MSQSVQTWWLFCSLYRCINYAAHNDVLIMQYIQSWWLCSQFGLDDQCRWFWRKCSKHDWTVKTIFRIMQSKQCSWVCSQYVQCPNQYTQCSWFRSKYSVIFFQSIQCSWYDYAVNIMIIYVQVDAVLINAQIVQFCRLYTECIAGLYCNTDDILSWCGLS